MSKVTRQEQAYHFLMERIYRHEIAPGTPLKEERLAAEIGISATPVREALRRLEREGWVENIPYKGCVLKQFTLQEVRELYLLRESIEVAVVPEVIRTMTPEEYQGLREQLTHGEELLRRFAAGEMPYEEYDRAFSEWDAAFHEAMIRASHLNRMIELRKRCNLQIASFALHSLAIAGDVATYRQEELQLYTVDQHRAILTALRLGWSKAAQELISAHIMSGLEHTLNGTFGQLDLDGKKNGTEKPTKRKGKSQC